MEVLSEEGDDVFARIERELIASGADRAEIEAFLRHLRIGRARPDGQRLRGRQYSERERSADREWRRSG